MFYQLDWQVLSWMLDLTLINDMHYVQLKYSYLLTAHQSGYAELGFANAPESTSSTLFVKKWNRFFFTWKNYVSQLARKN